MGLLHVGLAGYFRRAEWTGLLGLELLRAGQVQLERGLIQMRLAWTWLVHKKAGGSLRWAFWLDFGPILVGSLEAERGRRMGFKGCFGMDLKSGLPRIKSFKNIIILHRYFFLFPFLSYKINTFH